MPTEITVQCTNGIKEAMIELVPEFERAHGAKVNVSFGSTKLIIDDGQCRRARPTCSS